MGDDRHWLRVVVKDYGWIHLSLGLLGNLMFFVGSIFFLPQYQDLLVAGVWLFIAGSFLMLVGACGTLLVGIWKDEEPGAGEG